MEFLFLAGAFAERVRWAAPTFKVAVFARQATAGIETGKPEIRPGLINVLKTLNRLAPGLALKPMAAMSKPK